jgi:hypothetical protein
MEYVGLFYGNFEYILGPFGIFYGKFGIFPRLGMLHQEKSGNPDWRQSKWRKTSPNREQKFYDQGIPWDQLKRMRLSFGLCPFLRLQECVRKIFAEVFFKKNDQNSPKLHRIQP